MPQPGAVGQSGLPLDPLISKQRATDDEGTQMARVKVLPSEGVWTKRLAWIAVALSLGAVVAALVAAIGSGRGAWHFASAFAVLRYAFFAAIAGGILAVVAIVAMKDRPSKGRLWALLGALILGFGFAGYVGNQYVTARSLPAIHDVTTNLEDIPEFSALPVRRDNLDNVPDEGRSALAAMEPEQRWKTLHREAYGDLRTISVPWSVTETIQRRRRWREERLGDRSCRSRSRPAGRRRTRRCSSASGTMSRSAPVRIRSEAAGRSSTCARSAGWAAATSASTPAASATS
jgi:hypothetical protein